MRAACCGAILALSLAPACAPFDDKRDLDERRSDGERLTGGSLIPSRDQQRLDHNRALAAELEETIETLDGVRGARVHLDLADRSVLSRDRGATSTAAVVVRRGAGGPDEATLRALVAGAVPDLEAEGVQVILTGGESPGPQTVRVGPIEVTAASATTAKAWLGALLAMCLVLALGLVYAGFKLRRRRLAQRSSSSSFILFL